jgi:hypothetical protein
MPAPTVATYSAAALVAANTSFRSLIDGGSGPGKIRVRSSADVLLAEIILTDPCGTVNGTTGQLTFTVATQEDAATAGTAAYGEFCDSANVVHLALPCEAGTAAVSGKLVLNTLTLLAGNPVQVVSATIG